MKRSWIIRLIIIIPVINAVADVSTNYFSSESINPGNIRGILLFLFIVHILFVKPIWVRPTRIMFTYLVYILFLVFISSNIISSFAFYIKYFIAIMMFPIGFYFIRSFKDLKKLNVGYIVALSVMILNIIISNIFKIGASDYLDDSLYFGTSRVNITKNISVIILLFPIISYQYKKSGNWLFIVALFMVALVFTFLGLKRSALLTVIIGIIIIFIILKNKKSLIRSSFLVVLIIIAMWPIYGDTFTARYEAREEVIEATSLEEYEDQARYNEFEIVWDAFKNGSLVHQLFGSEIFNDREYFNVHRMLHMDYSILLNGTGLIGVAFFAYIVIYLFRLRSKYFRGYNHYRVANLLNASYIALLFSLLIMGIAGSVYAIGLRTEIFLYLGAILGIMHNYSLNMRTEISLNETYT